MIAVVIMTDYLPITYEDEGYCRFAYSALASFRMGMSGSASFEPPALRYRGFLTLSS